MYAEAYSVCEPLKYYLKQAQRGEEPTSVVHGCLFVNIALTELKWACHMAGLLPQSPKCTGMVPNANIWVTSDSYSSKTVHQKTPKWRLLGPNDPYRKNFKCFNKKIEYHLNSRFIKNYAAFRR